VLLTDIVAKLPAALAPLPSASVKGAYSLSVQTALAQLPTGAVRIRFAQLREAAPPGTFSADASHNETMVDLPLPKILAAINPALLARRSGQKQIEVPGEITGVFGAKDKAGAQVSSSTAASVAPAASPSPIAPSPAPVVAAAPPSPVAPKPAPVVAAAPPSPVASSPAPAAQKPPSSITSPPVATKPPASAPLPFATQKPSAPAPASTPLPFATQKPAAPAPASAPLPFASQKPATPAPAPSPQVAGGSKLTVRLSALSESWPEPVRQEIAQSKLNDASIGLPMDRVESAMKTGRIVFTWAELIQWLDVTFAPASSPHKDASLDLPLKVIAPLFMAQRKAPVDQKKIVIGENIPNLFEGLAKPAVQAAPAPAPAAVPEVVAAASAPAPATTRETTSPPTSVEPEAFTSAPTVMTAAVEGLGGIFGQPAKKEWSPQEITQKINLLPGIAASLIAMSDGLLVAGELPPPLKSETLAAFLPQMFGRMNHYSGEIQLGSLSTLTLQAGQTQCAIYKAGALYLAVLGKPGQTLPDSILQQVVGELAKRNQ
jgi:predicted regulator of Ras-like GTPase activity (Roadblock/LC7/MglB family)